MLADLNNVQQNDHIFLITYQLIALEEICAISFSSSFLYIFSKMRAYQDFNNVAATTITSKIKSLATIVNGFPQTSKMQNFVIIINFKLHPPTINLETIKVP